MKFETKIKMIENISDEVNSVNHALLLLNKRGLNIAAEQHEEIKNAWFLAVEEIENVANNG